MSASCNPTVTGKVSSNLSSNITTTVSSSTTPKTAALVEESSSHSQDLPGCSGWDSGTSSQPYLDILTNITTQQSSEIHPVFDPESAADEDNDEESDEEGEVFRRKAIEMESSPRMVKTRSQTSSQSDVIKDLSGRVVFAHKGKAIPCWFPGKVLCKSKKGYKVEFFSNLGVEICTLRNVMLYEDYFLRKSENSPLFKVPTKLKQKFQEALQSASKKP